MLPTAAQAVKSMAEEKTDATLAAVEAVRPCVAELTPAVAVMAVDATVWEGEMV